MSALNSSYGKENGCIDPFLGLFPANNFYRDDPPSSLHLLSSVLLVLHLSLPAHCLDSRSATESVASLAPSFSMLRVCKVARLSLVL
jgi:hypothetical protein